MKRKIAVIGCGTRISHVIHELLYWDGDVEVVAVMDKSSSNALKNLKETGIDCDRTLFFQEAELDHFFDIPCDGVLVGTNCNTHAKFAGEVIRRNKPLFLEKPVGICHDDLDYLNSLLPVKAPVVVSFPLRVAPVCTEAKKIIDRGDIGEIVQIQAVNNVAYGRGYYKKWYRNDQITGGLFLQKATHDLDCIRYLLDGKMPIAVAAMSSKQYYRGDRPAGLRCRDCDDFYSCPESTWVLEKISHEAPQPDNCSFAVDTGNQDSGSVLMQFANGMHVVYTQNFVVRKGSGLRMMRVIGNMGTLEFSFTAGTVKVTDNSSNMFTEIKIPETSSHCGGDGILARSFLNAMDGQSVETGTLEDGVHSAEICLAAEESARSGQFIHISPMTSKSI